MLKIPIKGIGEFVLHREPFSVYFEVEITVNGARQTYYLETDDLKLWMGVVGVHPTMIDRVADYVWNFRKARYTLSGQKLTFS